MRTTESLSETKVSNPWREAIEVENDKTGTVEIHWFPILGGRLLKTRIDNGYIYVSKFPILGGRLLKCGSEWK